MLLNLASLVTSTTARESIGNNCLGITSLHKIAQCYLVLDPLSALDIMYLGGWFDLSMMMRHTRSIAVEE